jgi:hypothetical protein
VARQPGFGEIHLAIRPAASNYQPRLFDMLRKTNLGFKRDQSCDEYSNGITMMERW